MYLFIYLAHTSTGHLSIAVVSSTFAFDIDGEFLGSHSVGASPAWCTMIQIAGYKYLISYFSAPPISSQITKQPLIMEPNLLLN